MTLERPTGYHTGHLLRRAQQLHHALWNREVSLEVSSVQFAALSALVRRPAISQAELGAELDLDRSTIADMVERMARNGLVERQRSTSDRRRMILNLTDRGEATVRGLRPHVDRLESLLTGGLGAAETERLQRMLLTILADGVSQGALQNVATPTR